MERGGHCDIRTVEETFVVLKIAEMVGVHCHGISWEKCEMH